MKPHKHAELIKQWADGAEIQAKLSRTNEWIDVVNFNWSEDYEFRIKPKEKKPVVRWMWAWEEHNLWCMSDTFMTENEAKELETESGTRYIKLEWSRTEFPE